MLYCLARLGVFRESDAQALVLQAFPQYLHVMRRLQTTYWLEPAGSHGVWGLDDYQMLPFLWGSSQARPRRGRECRAILAAAHEHFGGHWPGMGSSGH